MENISQLSYTLSGVDLASDAILEVVLSGKYNDGFGSEKFKKCVDAVLMLHKFKRSLVDETADLKRRYQKLLRDSDDLEQFRGFADSAICEDEQIIH